MLKKQKIKRLSSLIAFFILCLSIQAIAYATEIPIYIGDNSLEYDQNSLILDQDDSGGTVTLQFGNTINAYLQHDGNLFQFNDDIDLGGNEIKNFRVDNLAAAPTCDNNNLGRIYFNTTESKTYLCNGTSWVQIDTVAQTQVFDAYDNSGNVSLTTTETTLNIDTVRISDSAYTLNNDIITFNATGVYKLTGRLTADSFNTSGTTRSNIELRFETDISEGGFTDVAGTLCQDYMREQNNGKSSASCTVTWIGSFSVNDQVRLTHRMSGSTTAQTVPKGSALTIELIR